MRHGDHVRHGAKVNRKDQVRHGDHVRHGAKVIRKNQVRHGDHVRHSGKAGDPKRSGAPSVVAQAAWPSPRRRD